MPTLTSGLHVEPRIVITNSVSRRSFLAGATAAAAFVLTGCSSSGDGESAEVVEVRDVFGPIKVPKDPQRVVLLDDQSLGAILALGFPSDRIVGWARGEVPLSNYAYLDHLADLSQIENLGGEFDNPNIEAIVAAKPDLILMVAQAGDDFYTPIFEKLYAIGIPVFGVFNGYLSVDEFKHLNTDAGIAIQREAKAQEMNTSLDARIADIKARIEAKGPIPSAAFLRVFPWDMGTANTLMPLLDSLGVPGKRADAAGFSEEVSAENLSTFDEDILFVGDGQDVAKTRATLESNPLWAQLPAVVNGRVVFVNDLTWGTGYSMPAVSSMLDDIEKAFLG